MFLTVVFKQWLNTHIPLCKLDCKEGRMPKKWCLRTVVLEKTPESPLDSKEIKPVNLKGDQPWIFTGRTDAEVSVFWSSDSNRWLIGKVPDAGKDQGQKKKKASEDETAGQHHWCNEHELGQTPGNGEGQGDLACCSPWGCKESDTTGQLNNNHSSNDAGEEEHTGRDILARGLRALTTQVYWFQGTAQLQHYTLSNSFTPSLLPSFLFKIKFIYYLFLAALGLHCCRRASSSFGERQLLSSCTARASHCDGFSPCRAQALGVRGLQ